ncbi:MAG: NAD-dependent epimerase/dehydratase family protein [Clostridiales bacterium]|nr:NAD-dependent epimerase/dehydratase family protein [Clostridiales bacterium]
MKVLLTGQLPPSVRYIGARLIRDGHRVSALGRVPDAQALQSAGIAVRAHADLRRLMEAARFGAVVFFAALRCDDPAEGGSPPGSLLDELSAVVRAARESGVGQLILVTDRRAFGSAQAGREDEEPASRTPAGILLRAAEENVNRCAEDGVRTLVIRVTNLYAPGDPDSFFSAAAAGARAGAELLLDGTPGTPCDFLHFDDLALFIGQAIDERMSGVAHLACGIPRTYGEIAALLRRHLPGLRVAYTQDASRRATLETGFARAQGWVPRHDFARELDELLQIPRRKRRFLPPGPAKKRLRRLAARALPWLELILLGAAAWRLHALSQVSATARFVDYWLLYIAVMGTLHGGGMGALAGLVASAAHIAFWAETERELIFFLYNVDNWLVPAGYLLSGALFGYVRDSQRERLDALKREKDGRDSELKLAKAMYTEANEDRSRLLEQVLRYRDSYGRIYRITCELDAMLPQQIFLSALGIVEEMMQCRSVAIYARSGDLPFARLAVSSREAEPLPRSLDLGRMPALRNALDRGELFANTDLKPGYPAFASPIRDGEEMLAMIALWDVPFDRQTLYYENLLNVVSGLVQSALRRAVRYFNLSGDMYLEDTRILTDRAFRMALDVYQAVRKRQSGDFLLARLRGAWPMSAEEIDRRTGGAIRSVDLIGRLSDGEYYALFPQATAEEMPLIDRRLAAEGLRLEDVSREMAHV